MGAKAYALQYICSMQINTDRNRLNPDWAAKSVHLFLGIYPSIYGMYVRAYTIRPYRVTINFYRERILPMRIAGHMWWRMQYTHTGL